MPFLLQEYDQVINFKRNDQYEIYHQDGAYEILDCKSFKTSKTPKIFINLATLFDPNPSDFNALLNLFDSNVRFSIKVIENLLGYDNLRIIQISSFHQLLDFEFQNEYSLTKSLNYLYLKKRCNEFLSVFLFDTFGPDDNRNKVVDIFINNILSEKPVKIPINDIHINISHVKDVCHSLMNALTLNPGDYCIMSNDTITIKELSDDIMDIVGKKVDVLELPRTIDYLAEISSFPKNIYQKSNSISFKENLLLRVNEIKKTHIIQ